MSCLSFVRSSKPTRSTTLKNFPPAVCLKALIRKASGACVIAVLNKANVLLLLLCPVKSLKLLGYIAIVGLICAGGKFFNSSDCKSNVELDWTFLVKTKSPLSCTTAQLESKVTNRQRYSRCIAITIRYS